MDAQTRAEIRRNIDRALDAWEKQYDKAPDVVFIGAVCDACGAQNIFQKPNTIYPGAECATCGANTPLTPENLLLMFAERGEPGPGGPSLNVTTLDDLEAGNK